MIKPSPAEHFNRYFQTILADTAEHRELVHRIRYEVYCQEFGYEREEDCPGGQERDAYDRRALHCLLMHRGSGLPAGCVRLVGSPGADPDRPLPLEQHCRHSLDHPKLHPERLPRDRICEISRLAVATHFRRRAGEGETPYGKISHVGETEAERRTFPLISIALILAATALVELTERPHVFAMMETRLARLLQRTGLYFTRVGASMDYHGPRAPFYIDGRQAVEDLDPQFQDLYRCIRDAFSPDLLLVPPRSWTTAHCAGSAPEAPGRP